MSELTSITDIELILQTYSLEEIFEYNQLEVVDVLFFLVTERFVTLPTPRPL